MKRLLLSLTGFLLTWVLFAAPSGDTTLVAKPLYGREARAVVRFLDGNHYRKLHMNDSLSSAILDAYISEVDNSRSYFLASDVARFERFRYTIDDLTNAENVEPAYVIYNTFVKRFRERMDFVMNDLIGRNFDYSIDEYYESDRSNAPWASSKKELEELWRRIIKNQALNLKLAGRTSEEIKANLGKRYERLIRSMEQFRSDDVFAVYMNTMTESYDPHTNYFSPKAADLFQQNMSLSLEGIGARLQTENEYTKVVEVLPGGPAEKSNRVHVNDRIIGVAQGDDDIVDVMSWRVDDVVQLIKGPKGTVVRLQMLSAESGIAGPPVIVRLVRDKIELADLQASSKLLGIERDGRQLKLGVITLPSFYMDYDAMQRGDKEYRSTTRDVKRLIEDLQSKQVDGIVLDLRNNPGGSLKEAIDLTGLFIKDGPVVQVRNSIDRVEVWEDKDPAIVYSGPLVVMTNRFSASASEIFAGAIQDYRRGVVVGESTYGKGSVQTLVDLNRLLNTQDDVGQLKITFQKFYRVTGSSTQDRGVLPDINLPTPFDTNEFGEGSMPSAMPWDEIHGTLFEKTPMVDDRIVRQLAENYNERLNNDVSLEKFVAETNRTRERMKTTRVSLNESVRRKDGLPDQDDEDDEEQKLSGQAGGDEIQTDDPLTQMDDEYLREGLLVLADLISTRIG